jgi:hypothetical protein
MKCNSFAAFSPDTCALGQFISLFSPLLSDTDKESDKVYSGQEYTHYILQICVTCISLTFRRRNFLLNFSTPVFKMWIKKKKKNVALWNKRHFEEEKNGECAACLKYSVCIFVE